MIRSLLIAATICAASVASAQVVYQPVQYEYHTQTGRTFYYGGDNPRLIQWAANPGCLGRARLGFGFIPVPRPSYIFTSAPFLPVDRPSLVISDCDPLGITGLSVADARNQANARVPLYFRKAAPPKPAASAAETPVAPPRESEQPQGTIEIRPGTTHLSQSLQDRMAQPGSIVILPSAEP
jgi:hypothetical protein